jgi:c-di-GMP-binding flagellar brake protein YcgR
MVRIEYTSFQFQANTENLSLGGMLLQTTRRLPIGTKLKLEIVTPVKGMPPIQATGVVVRIRDSEPRGLAICFIDLSEKEKSNLAVILKQLDKPGN